MISSFCGGGACVDVEFVKSKAGESAGAQAVLVIVGHSKKIDGPSVAFTRDEWKAFIEGAKAGEFDVE